MNTEISVRPELRTLPIILSVMLLGMAAAIGGFYSLALLGLCLGAAPVGVMILWMTREVPAPEDRIAAVDLERKRRLAVAAVAPPRMARAA